MVFIKLNGFILDKKIVKEADGIVYILTKNFGILKCLVKGLYKIQSKNLGLMEVGNYNRFFILTNFQKFRIISALPLKKSLLFFNRKPYYFLWLFRIIKNLNLLETPKFLYFILMNLDKYYKFSYKEFNFWFLYHLLKELGYSPNLEQCHNCQRKLKGLAFFGDKMFLYCSNCKKDSYKIISSSELKEGLKIKSRAKVPNHLPQFIRDMIKNYLKVIKF